MLEACPSSPQRFEFGQKFCCESHQVQLLFSVLDYMAAVAKAPVGQISYFYRAAGSNPGAGPKNAFNFFLNRLFHIFSLHLRL